MNTSTEEISSAPFGVTRDGQPMSSVLSIYTECFAAMALAELSKAGGAPAHWEPEFQTGLHGLLLV